MSGRGVSREADQRFFGVVDALVADNVDPENIGRVKVTFPWFSTTPWPASGAGSPSPMRATATGSIRFRRSATRCVVAFMHGDMRIPIVIGGLYNGVDRPPFTRNGRDPKVIQTKAGHRILLEDKGGQEKIEIIDSSGNSIVIDTTANSISITAQGDISVEAQGQLTLSGNSGVSISSPATVTVRGQMIELN